MCNSKDVRGTHSNKLRFIYYLTWTTNLLKKLYFVLISIVSDRFEGPKHFYGSIRKFYGKTSRPSFTHRNLS